MCLQLKLNALQLNRPAVGRQMNPMNTSAKAEQRRNEILAIAKRLFAIQGFDKTSIQDILQEAQIARGTLYYYFESKEAIMNALVESLSEQTFSKVSKIANDTKVPVVERIILAVMAMNVNNDSSIEIINHINLPQNAFMHQKVQHEIMRKVPPILAAIVQEGAEEGVFDTRFPLQSMEMVIASVNALIDDAETDITDTEREERLHGLLCNIERILGAKPNSFENAFTAAINKGEREAAQ